VVPFAYSLTEPSGNVTFIIIVYPTYNMGFFVKAQIYTFIGDLASLFRPGRMKLNISPLGECPKDEGAGVAFGRATAGFASLRPPRSALQTGLWGLNPPHP
jgi:hypothetical protein